jgi:acylphosphatase
MKRISIKVAGIVQGVGFRNFAKRNAQTLGLTGFTKNIDDGSVLIEVQSENHATLALFVTIIEKGPSHSEVRHLNTTEIPIIDGESFFYIIC